MTLESQFVWVQPLSGPLPQDGEFKLHVRGRITAAHLRHIRSQLDLVIGWLEEDEAPPEPINETENAARQEWARNNNHSNR